MSEPTDHYLVIQTRGGQIDAYGKLVVLYQSSVFSVCYRLLGNRMGAEDITQETFIRAYKRLGTFDESRPFGPWIRRIATNLCINHLQKRRADLEAEIDEEQGYGYSGSESDNEGALIQTEQRECIRIAILKLPTNCRIAIELRHFQKLTYEEMAAEMQVPLNTVKSYLFRGRKKLAKLIREQSSLFGLRESV